MRVLWASVFFLIAGACYGQSLSLGVVGGARLTDDITGNATPESKRYVVGPMIDIGLPLGLAVEVDALYRSEGYSSLYQYAGVTSLESERANSWEFPILAKYKLSFPVVKPYIEAGYAPRAINGSDVVHSQICNPTTGACPTYVLGPTSTNWKASQGLVLGGGVQVGVGKLRLSPQVRYTRWNNAAISLSQDYGYQSTQNQVDVLLGIAWKLH